MNEWLPENPYKVYDSGISLIQHQVAELAYRQMAAHVAKKLRAIGNYAWLAAELEKAIKEEGK